MATYIEIKQHPTLSDRFQILLNALAPLKNYKSMNPLKSQVMDFRICDIPPSCVEVIMSTNVNYMLCALPEYNPTTMLGIFPVEKVNNVVVANNTQLVEQLEIILTPLP